MTGVKMDIFTGVPQGSILSPMLFLLMFNDMTDVIPKLSNSQMIPFFRWHVNMYILSLPN